MDTRRETGVLQQLAIILRAQTRDIDLLFRFGGEEFGVLLPHTALEELVAAAERIRRVTETTHFQGLPSAGVVTVSGGALEIPSTHPPPLKKVYAAADSLLYRAKREGRNRVVSECME